MTVHRVSVTLADVDRGIYEALDLRLARHPSESLRYLATRLLAYCLSYEEGIAFSKGGLSQTDEPPLSVRDLTGVLVAWIDVGSPSAERLHKASKAARRVILFTTTDATLLRKEASTRAIHKVEEIEVFHLPPSFVDAIAPALEARSVEMDLTRNDGQLYVTIAGESFEATVERVSLA